MPRTKRSSTTKISNSKSEKINWIELIKKICVKIVKMLLELLLDKLLEEIFDSIIEHMKGL